MRTVLVTCVFVCNIVSFICIYLTSKWSRHLLIAIDPKSTKQSYIFFTLKKVFSGSSRFGISYELTIRQTIDMKCKAIFIKQILQMLSAAVVVDTFRLRAILFFSFEALKSSGTDSSLEESPDVLSHNGPVYYILIGSAAAALVVFAGLLTYFVIAMRRQPKPPTEVPDLFYLNDVTKNGTRSSTRSDAQLANDGGPRVGSFPMRPNGRKYSRDRTEKKPDISESTFQKTIALEGQCRHNNIYIAPLRKTWICIRTVPLSCWVLFSADDILKYFLTFPENRVWYFMLSLLETICMKCQTCFPKKKKKISLISSTELAWRVIKINIICKMKFTDKKWKMNNTRPEQKQEWGQNVRKTGLLSLCGFICGVSFVIVCSTSLLLSVPREGCASWL